VLYLIDGSSQMYRAYHAPVRTAEGGLLRNAQGAPTNAVYIFVNMLRKLLNEHKPEFIAASFDLPGRTFRDDLVDDYKANRAPMPGELAQQIPMVHAACEALGVPILTSERYEADDVIGTLATDAGMPVDVVTGDRDLFQLVDDDERVRVLYIARGVGRHERVTNEVVRGKYGIDGRQYADFAALRGDPSDGLPGVPGVGEKTAATLLDRFGDLDGILAAADDPDANLAPGPRRKIKEAQPYLAVAPTVVAVARDIDLGKPDLTLPRTPPDPDVLVAVANKWGLDSPVARLVDTLTLR
jgi:5'-3' exonuclease